MTTFSLLNFGCRASQADGAALKRQLLESGFIEGTDARESHVAILNTCTVTAAADAEIRQTVRRIHRQHPGCRILVTGCYAQRAPEEIAALEGVAWVVGNSHKRRIVEILKDASATHRDPGAVDGVSGNGHTSSEGTAQISVDEVTGPFHFLPVFPDDRTRPTLKVQDGCSARCAFCIIPAVRGKSRSLPPQLAIDQVRSLEAAGYNEVVLSGINLGSYGRDLDRSVTFLVLLERMLNETRIKRLRISSIEPMDVSPALIRLAASEPRLADHFHVPLQSGCDRILRRMNRRYWAAQYAERILAVRESMPHAGIGADVMTGFPGETAADHAESVRFIESLPFTYLHIFPYSARPSTPAAQYAGQVDGRIAHERGAELRGVIARKRQTFLQAQVGRTLSALTLSGAHEGETPALSSNFIRVHLLGPQPGPNRLVLVRVGRVHEGCAYGFLEERA